MSITLGSDAAAGPQPGTDFRADRVSSEVNHRIANSLSMIASLVRVQARNIGERGESMSTGEVEALLAGIGVRIDAVASLHHRLSTVPKMPVVDLGEPLKSVCQDLVATLPGRGQVALLADIDDDLLVECQAVLPILWIVSEMVMNAIKYAHPAGSPGQIRIVGRPDADGTLLLDIIDDGVGLPESFDPHTDGGFGFRLVRALAHRLGASVTFACPGIGLHFRLCVPAAGAPR